MRRQKPPSAQAHGLPWRGSRFGHGAQAILARGVASTPPSIEAVTATLPAGCRAGLKAPCLARLRALVAAALLAAASLKSLLAHELSLFSLFSLFSEK